MAELGHLPTKVLIQKLVLGRRVEPLLTANDMRNAHQVIVYHIGQVIGRHAIGL